MKFCKAWKLQIRQFSCGCSAFNNVRVRFAPSPTGLLHLGGLRTALYNYLFAKSRGGTFVLRIEDTDQTRLVAGADKKLIDTLHWSGIIPDEGPSFGGQWGPYRQSERLHIYKQKSEELVQGGHAYYCFCTSRRLDLLRKQALKNREVIKYDNKCRHLTSKDIQDKLSKGTPHVIRLKLEDTVSPFADLVYGPVLYNAAEQEGDPVLLKSDNYPTYHFANVVDDHLMGITHVLRGMEWQTSTPKHIKLYEAFGWTPPRFGHLPLLLNKDGTKLSKRHGDVHVEQYRVKGYLPDAVLNYVTYVGGGFDCETGGLTLAELVDHFSLDKLRVNSGRLEGHRINEFNQVHLKRMVLHASHRQNLVKEVKDLVQMKFKDRLSGSPLQQYFLSDAYIDRVLRWSVERIHVLADLLSPSLEYLWILPEPDRDHIIAQHANARYLLTVVTHALQEASGDIFQGEVNDLLRHIAKKNEIKFPQLMKLLRLVLSGLTEGPSVAEIMTVLGQEVTLLRLEHSLALLDS